MLIVLQNLHHRQINKMKITSVEKFYKMLIITSVVFTSLAIFFASAPKAHAALPTIDPIYKILTPTADCKNTADAVRPAEHCFSGMGATTARIWYDIMAVVNSIVLAALIWVAFMNILRIQINDYAVKKILPTFIMAIILANFSFLIARMLLDVANIAISAFLTGNQSSGVTGAFNKIIAEKPTGPKDFPGNYAGYITVYILKQFFVGVGAVFVAILAFIFLIRNYFIYFLICIAPAACMALALPISKKYFQQWFSQLLKWMFMPVIAVFWLWLAGEFISAIGPNAHWILPVGFAGVCLYMAITSPFKAGGAAVTAWGNWGKKAWGKTGGQAVKGAQWMGGGGYSSWRAYSNQQKAVVAKSRSIEKGDKWDLMAKKYEGNANRWTKANPRAWREGIKSRITTGVTNAQKAPYKTPWYNTLAGRTAAIDAIYQASFETDRNRTATDTGIEARKQLEDIWKNLDPDYLNKMKAESKKAERSRERAILGFEDSEAGFNAYQKHLIMADFDDKGAAKLDVTHPGIGAKALGDLKSIADAYRKNFRRRDNKEELLRNFITDPEALSPDLGASARRNRSPAAAAGGAANPSSATPAAGQPSGETETEPAKQVLPDMSRMEELLQQLVEQQKAGTADTNKAISAAVKPTNVGLGIGHIPELEVRIKSIDPAASEQLRLLQTRVARNTSVQAMRMAQKEDSTLQAIAQLLKSNQNPEQVEQYLGQAEAEMEKGNFDQARVIIEQYHPEAKPALDLTQKSQHE